MPLPPMPPGWTAGAPPTTFTARSRSRLLNVGFGGGGGGLRMPLVGGAGRRGAGEHGAGAEAVGKD
jgi:hypothetical protein